MWVSLVFIVLLFMVALFQSKQGLFSAFIMMVLTITCAAFAYGAHEWVAVAFLAKYWKPDYAHPISLAILFGVPMLVLRLIFDKLIRRSCLLPAMVDRIGGGVCGLVTGLVMVGVAATAFQMLPFGETVVGFSRFDLAIRDPVGGTVSAPPQIDAAERGLWLNPDRFSTGVAAKLSEGVLSGSESFLEDHPSFVQAAAWVNTVHAGVSRYAPPGSIRVVSTSPVAVVYRETPGSGRDAGPSQYEPISPEGGKEFRVVRVKLSSSASDANKTHLFSLRQFRLVGDDGEDRRQYFPVAIQEADATQTINRHVKVKRYGSEDWPVVDALVVPRQENSNEVELVFELASGFAPDFIEYKRNARVKVSFKARANARNRRQSATPTPNPSNRPAPPEAPSATTAGADKPSDTGRSSRRSRRRRTNASEAGTRGGSVRGFTSISGSSFFGDALPFELKRYQGLSNTEVSAGALNGGHLVAVAKEQEGGTDPPVSKLRVPEGKRLLHLNVGKLTARSTLGRALSQAVSAVQNYTVTAANGGTYKISGKYSLADVNDEKIFEVQYFPDQVGTVGGLGKFSRIDEKELTKDDDIVFLFVVDPGAEIVRFSTGGAASRADDLRSENLKAPD